MVGVLPFQLQAKAASSLCLQVFDPGHFSGRFRAFKVGQSPLFITSNGGFGIGEDQVSRVNACLSPFTNYQAIDGLG